MEKQYCHNCGAELKDGATFCVKCGAKVPPKAVTPDVVESPKPVSPDKRSVAWWLALIGFITSILALFGYIPVPWTNTFYASKSLWLCVPSLVLCIISLVVGRNKDKDLKPLAVAGLIINIVSVLVTVTIIIILVTQGLGGYGFKWSSSSYSVSF